MDYSFIVITNVDFWGREQFVNKQLTVSHKPLEQFVDRLVLCGGSTGVLVSSVFVLMQHETDYRRSKMSGI